MKPPRLRGGAAKCGPRPVFASSCTLAFALQLRKITEYPQSGHLKIAGLISAERGSFGRLGHRLAMALTGLLACWPAGLLACWPAGLLARATLGFRVGRQGQRKYLPGCLTRGIPT
jgi:hypothetical protein